MCSPVGHSIAALAIGVSGNKQRFSWQFIVFCLISGNAADLDLIVGWVLGDINKFHHLGSHSISAALIFGSLVFLTLRFFSLLGKVISRSNQVIWSITGAIMYLSHCLLDLISLDDTPPIGMQLFWPVSEQFFTVPFIVFRSFLHHTVGSDMWGMLIGLFSWHNLVTVIQEMVIILPGLLLGLWYRNRVRRNS